MKPEQCAAEEIKTILEQKIGDLAHDYEGQAIIFTGIFKHADGNYYWEAEENDLGDLETSFPVYDTDEVFS